MLLALTLVAAVQSAPSLEAEAAAIRALRARSNDAIAARDLDGVMAPVSSGAVEVAGGGSLSVGADAIRASWLPEFDDPDFVTYVRTPSRIDVAQDGRRAAESGEWTGDFKTAAGPRRLSGRYFAFWSRKTGSWAILSETFVTLRCAGPGC